MFGRSLRERIEELERDLYPVVRVNNYLDMPFAIFLYDPHDELVVRGEVQLLATRLKNKGKHVQVLSLAEVMQEALELALGNDGLKKFYDAERENGVEAAIQTVYHILSHERPLDKLVAERLHVLSPAYSIAFLTRAEALFPVYRTSALLDRLVNEKVRVPTVLFYPGTLEGVNGLRFMGVLEAEHNYRARIY